MMAKHVPFLLSLCALVFSVHLAQAQGHVTTIATDSRITADIAAADDGSMYITSGIFGSTVFKLTSDGQGVSFPSVSGAAGIAIGPDGNVYVSEYNTGLVKYFSPDGTLLGEVANGLNGPTGLAFDSGGNLYVSNFGSDGAGRTVSKVDLSGTVTTVIDSDDLSGPVGLAVDEADNLYVTSQNTKKILQYTPDGTVRTLVEVTGIGDANIGWLAYLDGALYTTVWANNVIYKIGLDGTAEQFAGTGMDSSIDGDLNTASFSGPNGIGASPRDNALFVSDSRTRMLRKITLDASSVGAQDEAELPSRYDLLKPNYPNPFSTSTTVSYTVPETAHVYIGIYNMQGQRVRILVDAMRGPGDHMVVWNTNDTHEASLSSGVYLCKLVVGDQETSRTILFFRDSEPVW